MNKTLVFIIFSILVALALLEALVLLIVSPDQFGVYSGFIIVMLGLASGFAATVYSLGKQKQEIESVRTEAEAVRVEANSKLDVVQRQTNGTLTKLIDRNHALAEENREKDAIIAQYVAMGIHPPMKGSAHD
jgi:hypothetical protein